MKKTLLAALALACLPTHAAIYVTGIVDPDVNFNARAIELYISGTEDLANYDLQRAANNTAFDETFSLSGTYTDQFVYVVANDTAFDGVFGTGVGPTLQLGAISGNGNDGFRIVNDGTNDVVDVVGEGGTNNYLDSYLYRVSGSGPDAVWTAANWSIPGNNTLDGLSAAETAAAVPFGTFTIPEPAASLLGALGLVALLRRRR